MEILLERTAAIMREVAPSKAMDFSDYRGVIAIISLLH
jgi:hypothetical protein